MSIRVGKRRVRRNLAELLWLSLLAVLLGAGMAASPTVAAFGAMTGALWGVLRWHGLRRRIERSGDPHAPNRIFVRFLSATEAVLSAAAWSLPLLGAVTLCLALLILANWAAGGAVLMLLGSFGTASALGCGALLMRYERVHGPLYFQYASEHWGGSEALLFQRGRVVRALAPEGLVRVDNALWRARSTDGATIAAGQAVEVVDCEGLCLRVAPLGEDARATES